MRLFYWPKGDKVGDNISIKNPDFKSALTRQLALLRRDMINNAMVEILLNLPPER